MTDRIFQVLEFLSKFSETFKLFFSSYKRKQDLSKPKIRLLIPKNKKCLHFSKNPMLETTEAVVEINFIHENDHPLPHCLL